MTMTMTVRALVIAATLALGAGVAAADEAKTPVSAAMILSIVGAPIESRASAFDESLRRPLPPTDPTGGEVLADGSIRYGKAIITVRNPCPPGEHWDPPPLPGRRSDRLGR